MLAKVNKNDERKDWFLLSRVCFFCFCLLFICSFVYCLVLFLFVCLFVCLFVSVKRVKSGRTQKGIAVAS